MLLRRHKKKQIPAAVETKEVKQEQPKQETKKSTKKQNKELTN
ncbi:hypothetical protein U1P98_07535 [Lysinibacillus irui]|uniref:3-methyladenine DNA glycosylase n=1 Tax=Lysinibacillus irui TaxID=2998077 RepID=A0ABU5NJL0_9BACI|nr:hypothetical protein [Lysinibacillus irui]MEA0553767.1 hypothetical protein [Lysinibacillus irui]MEA0976151.1 hypothetical protein [Lysinibacillus irui]MEA1042305.1 hypothetical protein [Lysinibacillus irui]